MQVSRLKVSGAVLALFGVALAALLNWMIFFYVPSEASQGIIQRIMYVHVPSAWVAFLAFGIVALCSAVYLWLGDERLDMAAQAAAEGGWAFMTVVLITGPLWGRVAWGTYWTWEPRLTLSLLLWVVYLGYFLVRSSAESAEKGKRLAAIVGIVASFNIPLIHMSVMWFRSLHPGPVVLKPEGPTMPAEMLWAFGVGFLSFTLIFVGLFLLSYATLVLRAEGSRRAATVEHPSVPRAEGAIS